MHLSAGVEFIYIICKLTFRFVKTYSMVPRVLLHRFMSSNTIRLTAKLVSDWNQLLRQDKALEAGLASQLRDYLHCGF